MSVSNIVAEQSDQIKAIKSLAINSKSLYLYAYEAFKTWKNTHNESTSSEPALLLYFKELTKHRSSSSLLQSYLMLKSMIKIHEGIDINLYMKLKTYLKKESHIFRKKMNEQSDQMEAINSLAFQSKTLYLSSYAAFKTWKEKHTKTTSESVMLLYFKELTKNRNSSSLLQSYSILKCMIRIHEGIDIDLYMKLKAYLKKETENVSRKSVATFSSDNITKFINDAPDSKYLHIKVALIMGAMYTLHLRELYRMKLSYIQDNGSSLVVDIPESFKTDSRTFTITDQYYHIVKKYLGGRTKTTSVLVFHQYSNDRVLARRIGINSFTRMGETIAKFLKLKNPELYSGQSFRKSSSNLVLLSGGELQQVNRYRKSVPAISKESQDLTISVHAIKKEMEEEADSDARDLLTSEVIIKDEYEEMDQEAPSSDVYTTVKNEPDIVSSNESNNYKDNSVIFNDGLPKDKHFCSNSFTIDNSNPENQQYNNLKNSNIVIHQYGTNKEQPVSSISFTNCHINSITIINHK